jgi:hypothetical protein
MCDSKRPSWVKRGNMRIWFGLLLVFCASGVVIAKSEKREVCVFVNGLDERTLGFTLSSDEKADAEDAIVRRIGHLAKGSGHIAERSTASVESAKARHAVGIVFTIRQFFLTYHSMAQHQGTIHVMITVFDTPNGYSRPCFTVSSWDSGGQYWGNYKPFMSCLFAALNSFDETFEPARDRGKSESAGTLEDFALASTTYDCGNSVSLTRPEFSPQTIGYSPLDEEIHDFSSEVAYYLEMITDKRVIFVGKESDDSLTTCATESARFECSRTNNTFSLSLVPVPAESGKAFNESVAMKKGADWNDSALFSKLIYTAFVKFNNRYRSYKAKK